MAAPEFRVCMPLCINWLIILFTSTRHLQKPPHKACFLYYFQLYTELTRFIQARRYPYASGSGTASKYKFRNTSPPTLRKQYRMLLVQ